MTEQKNKGMVTLLTWIVGYLLGAATVGCIVGVVSMFGVPNEPGGMRIGLPIAGVIILTFAFIIGIILATINDTEKK